MRYHVPKHTGTVTLCRKAGTGGLSSVLRFNFTEMLINIF